MELIIHGRDGSRLRVKGMLDSVPASAANVALKMVIVDAVAEVITD